MLVSVSHYASQQAPPVARVVREFPRVPAVALLTGSETYASAVLSLGQQGVRALVDVRDAQGWRELRRLITEERSETVERMAVAQLHLDLAGAPEDCLRFFDALFKSPATVCTVRQLSRRLGVLPSTLMSRFFRANLPAPKSYLAMARLVRAARLLENPGLSVAQVSTQLEYSSPQSFSRHTSTILQCTAVAFRRRYDGATMFEHMRQAVVIPHHAVSRTAPGAFFAMSSSNRNSLAIRSRGTMHHGSGLPPRVTCSDRPSWIRTCPISYHGSNRLS